MPTNVPGRADDGIEVTDVTTTGVAAVVAYLEGRDASFQVVEHAPTERATDEADIVDWPRERMAKTVVLQDAESGYLLAIVPASERVDLHKLRRVLGAGREIRLATEAEIARDFPTLQVGATPPLGPMLPRAEVIDQRLLEETRVLCAGGDHRHSIVLDPGELAFLADAQVADICVEDA